MMGTLTQQNSICSTTPRKRRSRAAAGEVSISSPSSVYLAHKCTPTLPIAEEPEPTYENTASIASAAITSPLRGQRLSAGFNQEDFSSCRISLPEKFTTSVNIVDSVLAPENKSQSARELQHVSVFIGEIVKIVLLISRKQRLQDKIETASNLNILFLLFCTKYINVF